MNPNESEALEDESWVDAMQEELLQFKIQKVWILVDLPYGKKAIGTKWVYRNKKDERGVVVRNKARLVAQGHRQEEGIDYDEMDTEEELLTSTLFLKKAREHDNTCRHFKKTEWNAEVHEINDLAYRGFTIHHALPDKPEYKQLENVPVPLDHFPVNALTSKVFSFMVKNGKHFSGKVTPLFSSMLVQPLRMVLLQKRPSEAQPTPLSYQVEATVDHSPDPSPRPSPSNTIPIQIPRKFQGESMDSDITQEATKPDITTTTEHGMKSVSIKQRLSGKISLKEKLDAKGFQERRERSRLRIIEETEDQGLLQVDHYLNNKASSKDRNQQRMGKRKLKRKMSLKVNPDGIPEAEKSFKRSLPNDALIRNYDDIKARIEADRLLAEKLQEEEREQFIIEERAKFVHDTIVAQRKFLAQQRSEAIRNRPPTKNQLRNQMMTYLKHVGNFKHSNLKTKKFEEYKLCMKRLNGQMKISFLLGLLKMKD
ncbi:putative ribonuclease H-like domain-containing protein [Tanacetum coccineum]